MWDVASSRTGVEVIGIYDGRTWTDPLWEQYFGCYVRILDYYHVSEHLHEAATTASSAGINCHAPGIPVALQHCCTAILLYRDPLSPWYPQW